ncbi:MAG TPA: hypothetical protein VLA44_08570 [Clostridia bacterium]|nr:hypothetical protein [Clostridia bacterium]
MPRRSAPPPPEEPDATDATEGLPGDADGDADEAPPRALPDLSALPIAGLGRRQVAMLLGAILAVWIIAVFARQVGDASAASDRAQVLVSSNEELRRDINAYRRELEFIQRQEYILQQARGYGLGAAREVPFSLAADAPPVAADAPGSAAVRVGADTDESSPLDHWLELLFGPGG